MNCRPGDLAVVVRADTPGLTGRFVIVDRAIPNDGRFGKGLIATGPEPGWICRPAAKGQTLPALNEVDHVLQLPERPIADCILRPIRPNEGEDESLSWAKPRVEEPA